MKELQLGKIKCIHGDCMDYMATLQDGAYDLAIVDPPYGIGASEMNMGGGKNRKWNKGKQWDNDTPNQEYFNELFRVSKNQIVWGGNYFPLPLTRSWIIWDKGIAGQNISFADCEMAWNSFDKLARMARIPYSGFIGADKDGGKIHPTQKPVQLYKWLLQNYAKQGYKILDTHGGSFSHAIACHDLGFELTIIEKDEDYFNQATERLKLHQRQLTIF